LATIHGLHVAGISEREQPLHARTIQTLRRLTGFHDDVREFRAVHHDHGANLLGLGVERNSSVGLLVR
jgi:hypothetical protein